MTKATEMRTALSQLESLTPTLQRILKAAQAGAALLDTLEEQQKTHERNIAGLKEREERALKATQDAKNESIRVTEATTVCVESERQRQEAAEARTRELEARLASIKDEVYRMTQSLADARKAVEDAQARAQRERERAERIAAAAAEAAR